MVSLLWAWYPLTAAAAASALEAYHHAGGLLHHRSSMMHRPMHRRILSAEQPKANAATDLLKKPESDDRSLRRTEMMQIPPMRRRVLTKKAKQFDPSIELVSMSMLGTIEMSTPMEPSETSMSTRTIEVSMPIETSETSMSMGTIEMSMPILISEMSLSMGTIEVSMPIETSETSMSMGTIEMSMPILISEMSLSMGTIEVSMPIETSETSMSMGTDTSMPIETSETSMSMGTIEMSMPILISEMSLPIGMIDVRPSPKTTALPSTTMPSKSLTSSRPNKSPTKEPSDTPTYYPTYSPSDIADSASIKSSTDKPITHSPTGLPINKSEMSMSMGVIDILTPTSMPTRHVPTKSPTRRPMTATPTKLSEMSMSMGSIVATVEVADTISPTRSLSKSPLPGIISVETITQLQLVDIKAVMDEHASNAFKQSCSSFLEEYLVDAEPPIFTVTCNVTNQQLLSGRRLRAGRGLKGETSLLVDVTVEGSAKASNSVTEASDIPFNEKVIETFAMHSSQFAKQLQEDGSEAGIDDFDSLTSTSVYSIDSDVSEIVESSDGSEGSESGGLRIISITTISICSLVILAVFATFIYALSKEKRNVIDDELSESGPIEINDGSKRRNELIDDEFGEPEPIESESSESGPIESKSSESKSSESGPTNSSGYSDTNDVYTDSLLSREQHRSVYSADKTQFYPEMTPIHEACGYNTYEYDLDDGLASPESILSLKNLTPVSLGSAHQKVMDWIMGKDINNRQSVDIVAPPGRLGVIIDTCSEGSIVHGVKVGSPLEGLIFKGDLIVAIDDEDTRERSAHSLTKLIAKKSNMIRKITVVRSDLCNDGAVEGET